MRLIKDHLELVGAPNFYTWSSKKINSITLARCAAFRTVFEDAAKKIKAPFNKNLLESIDLSYIVSINSPLVLNINYPNAILINIKPLKIDNLCKLDIYTTVATMMAGITFFKRLPFNEAIVFDFLKSLLIRIFGKRFGLLVSSRKTEFEKILREYVSTWRSGVQDIDMFISQFNELTKIDKGRFVAYSLKYTGVEGLPVFEDYYRLIACVIGSTIPNKVFKPTLVAANPAVANQIASLWHNAKRIS